MLVELSLTLLQNGALRYIMAPLIGAVIGYFTNLIAVKMLFHPRKPWYIGKWRIPFTPGVIPKRKKALAKTIGHAVSTELITHEDLRQVLLSDSARETVARGVVSAILDQEVSVRAQMQSYLGTEREAAFFSGLSQKISAVLADGIGRLDLSAILAEKGVELAEKHFGGMLSIFLGRDKIQSIAQNLGEQLIEYMRENGVSFLEPHVFGELDTFLAQDANSLVEFCGLSRQSLCDIVGAAYESLVREKAHVLLDQIHLEEIVEQKILAMDNRELERLTLYVMKKELDTVINLGAILGAVIGILNVFFY